MERAAAGQLLLARELGRLHAELDKQRAILRQHGIDPGEDPAQALHQTSVGATAVSIRAALVHVARVRRASLLGLIGETIKRFIAKPSDRAGVVQQLAESVGGSLESYYWMFEQYDGLGGQSRRAEDDRGVRDRSADPDSGCRRLPLRGPGAESR